MEDEEELLLNQMEEEEESSCTTSAKNNETQAKMSMKKSLLYPLSNTLQESALIPPPIY
jgi:hypothetical protein